jgi:hypothetical protein
MPLETKYTLYTLQVHELFNEEEVLHNAGMVAAEIAKSFAESEFEKYCIIQDRLFESDINKEIKKLLEDKNINAKEEK